MAAAAVSTSSGPTGNPASASVAAIRWRVREVVLVINANGSSASRIARTASTAPSIGFHESVSTPSMSMRTPRMGRDVISPTIYSGNRVE